MKGVIHKCKINTYGHPPRLRRSSGIRLPLVLFVRFQLDCMTKCYWHSNNRALGQCMLEPYVWTRRHFVFEKAANDCMP